MAISPVTSSVVASSASAGALASEPGARAEAFTKVLRHFVGDVNLQQARADSSVERLITGESDDVNETVLALTKAELSFRMFVDVRDKVIDTYQEIMRMQL